MVTKKPTWNQRLSDSKGLPKVEKIREAMSKRWGSGTIVIPAPMEVDQVMRNIPSGRLITINDIRAALAKKHKATIGCPLTTGIFAWIAAQAAEERKQQNALDITPYWRTLKTGGFINEKYPGGVRAQKKLLEHEGHAVKQKGKKYIVENFEKALFRI